MVEIEDWGETPSGYGLSGEQYENMSRTYDIVLQKLSDRVVQLSAIKAKLLNKYEENKETISAADKSKLISDLEIIKGDYNILLELLNTVNKQNDKIKSYSHLYEEIENNTITNKEYFDNARGDDSMIAPDANGMVQIVSNMNEKLSTILPIMEKEEVIFLINEEEEKLAQRVANDLTSISDIKADNQSYESTMHSSQGVRMVREITSFNDLFVDSTPDRIRENDFINIEDLYKNYSQNDIAEGEGERGVLRTQDKRVIYWLLEKTRANQKIMSRTVKNSKNSSIQDTDTEIEFQEKYDKYVEMTETLIRKVRAEYKEEIRGPGGAGEKATGQTI